MPRRSDGEIKKIGSLFEVYKSRLRAPEKTVIKAFVEVVHDLYSISIEERVCSYTPTTKTLHIHTSGTIKSEIYIHKDEILTHLKGRIGEKGAPHQIL